MDAARLVLMALFGVLAMGDFSRAQTPATTPLEKADIVFVCEHGSVKSLMAATIFNNAARERGLSLRAISLGVDPDASVPPKIAAALAAEGFDAAGFKPQRLSPSEIGHARRIVSIGVDLSAVAPKNVTVLRWDDVPSASADYAASHLALTKRVDQLLMELH